MRNRPAPQSLPPAEAQLWYAAVEAVTRQQEMRARAARKPLPVRVWRWLWLRRRQAVPVLAICGLLAAAVVLRAQHANPLAVAVLVMVGLAAWWVRRGRHHPRPAMAAVRPVLAGVYLVAAVAA